MASRVSSGSPPSLPSFAQTFSKRDTGAAPDGTEASDSRLPPISMRSTSPHQRKRRHPLPDDETVDVKQEQEQDELDPSPPPESQHHPKRRKVAGDSQDSTAAAGSNHHSGSPDDGVRPGSKSQPEVPSNADKRRAQDPIDDRGAKGPSWVAARAPLSARPRLPPVATVAPQSTSQEAASPAPSSSTDTVLPPPISFSTRRRQSQNSAGADKISRLSIRPPPSPYRTLPGGSVQNMLPAIHSAPIVPWNRNRESIHNPPATGMKLPVVPPIGQRPGAAPPTPRRPPAPSGALFVPAPGRLTGGPRTAGLPFAHTRDRERDSDFVQPISAALVPPTPRGMSHSNPGERAAFLAPFGEFFDALNDAKGLKKWLTSQLQQSAELISGARGLREDVNSLKARVAALEAELKAARGGEPRVASEPILGTDPTVPSPPSPPTLHHTSAARLEPQRSAAPEPSAGPKSDLNGRHERS